MNQQQQQPHVTKVPALLINLPKSLLPSPDRRMLSTKALWKSRSNQNAHYTDAVPVLCRQVGAPAEEDLSNWGHHPDVSTLPDDIMKQAAGDDVTFVFSCQVCSHLYGQLVSYEYVLDCIGPGFCSSGAV